MEDEMELYILLADTSKRCGNVNTMDEQMTKFIEGLNPTHLRIVSQYRHEIQGFCFRTLLTTQKRNVLRLALEARRLNI